MWEPAWPIKVLIIVTLMVLLWLVTGYTTALWAGGIAAVVIASRHTPGWKR